MITLAGTGTGTGTGTPIDPDTCLQGYVWREAVPGDHVCVTPETRALVAQDNSLAASRRADSCATGVAGRPSSVRFGLTKSPGELLCANARRMAGTAAGECTGATVEG